MGETLPKQAILIVNAMSRTGSDAFDEVRDKLVTAGMELIASHAVEDPDQMETVICAAISEAPMVIVGGGDGSLSTNVELFMGSNTVFGIVPLGTANSFAGTLGIPKDIDSAIDVIAKGERKRIDLGCIDGHYFVNSAAIGLSPMIAEDGGESGWSMRRIKTSGGSSGLRSRASEAISRSV